MTRNTSRHNNVTKIELVAKLIGRKSGATVEQIQSATGWQAHSIRAAISGLRKRGSKITLSELRNGTSAYKDQGGIQV
ncbi:MAG: DUF3489 domain-containing protein [Alphaproteobacteria bacterium]|nr:DUF3489 domain-containing protein [Alphaproteobacteria bacterium]